MKRYIFIWLLALTGITLHAQETSLTLEVIPGKLANQLTEEQMKTVKELTLTGEMYNCDFYTIRDRMSKLEVLNLKNALADTIPDKAFSGRSLIDNIILSKETAYVGDNAFEDCGMCCITFTGNFPKLGNHIWGEEDSRVSFSVSEDNPYCHIISNCLYSSDGRTLFLAPKTGNFYIREGTLTIGKSAFETCWIRFGEITIPASVTEIQSYAFWGIKLDLPVNASKSDRTFSFTCYSLIPPILGENAFEKESFLMYELYVPKESIELYKSSSQWNQFNKIYPINNLPPSCINNKSCMIAVSLDHNNIFIKGNEIISVIKIQNLNGQNLYSVKPEASSFLLERPTIKGIYLLSIQYRTGEIEIIKLINS